MDARMDGIASKTKRLDLPFSPVDDDGDGKEAEEIL